MADDQDLPFDQMYYAGYGDGSSQPDLEGQAEPASSGDIDTEAQGDYTSVQDYSYDPAADSDTTGSDQAPLDTSTALIGPGDTWMEQGSAALGQLAPAFKLGIGPNSRVFNFDSGSGSGSGGQMMPFPGLPTGGGKCGPRVMSLKSQILYKAACFIGKRISAKAIVRFIIRWGAAAAANTTGLAANELLALFFDAKGRPHRRRGPHLYTVVKRIRQGQRYSHMLAKYARKTHSLPAHHHHPVARRRSHG